MTLTIDNLDGLGPIDYTAAIAADLPFKIERTINQPSVCSGTLDLSTQILSTQIVPARRGRVVATAANGTVLFTGYLAIEPTGIYAGVSSTGPVYRYAISAVSDEWLLDKQTPTLLALSLASSAGAAFSAFTQRVAPGLLSTSGVTNARAVGVLETTGTAPWSKSAGELAAAAYSAYRAVSGTLTMQSAATVTHSLNFDSAFDTGGGSLTVAALKTSSVKELANDVTLTGELEPAAYIAETFLGDGTTTTFQLTDIPFRPGSAASRNLLTDPFNQSVIDTQIWAITDPGSHLSLTAAGLTMNGGNGSDGQTTLTALDFIEIGGSLLIEASSVTLTGASQGVLCGLYNGPVLIGNCLAGYSITQSGGVPSITPLVNGVEAGTTFPIEPGHTYTLRIRLNCPEVQRVRQTFYAMPPSVGEAGVVESFGGGAVAAPLIAVFDLIDLGAASNTPATVLYDGATALIASAPASCLFAAVDCVQIFGSIGAITLTQTGSAWITSTLPSGTKQTRLIGIAGQGVDCKLSSTGLVTFFAGRTPVLGELVTVTYRNHQRAVARLEDAASVASETSTGIPGTARWLGKVLKPPARTSADCESAALAILSFSTSRAAALSGTCEAINPQQQADIWPGDALALTEAGTSTNVIARKVEIEPASSFPEALTYRITFANDWAEGLGLTLSEAIAADAILPLTATTTTALAAGTTLPNLQQLQLVSATTTALQIDAGLTPPAGGGFEVRRRDNNFGPNIPQDLVLRSPVRSFSIPRAAQVEQYFVRMYDASTPPLYSRFSSAVFINLPTS
jgi:hypothetical protein